MKYSLLPPFLPFNKLDDDSYIRKHQLLSEVTPISSVTLWRMIKNGKFPKPIHISKQLVLWRVGDIRMWQKNPTSYKSITK